MVIGIRDRQRSTGDYDIRLITCSWAAISRTDLRRTDRAGSGALLESGDSCGVERLAFDRLLGTPSDQLDGGKNTVSHAIRLEEWNHLAFFDIFSEGIGMSWHPSSGLGAPSLKLCFHGTGGGSRKGSTKQSFGRDRTAAELRYEEIRHGEHWKKRGSSSPLAFPNLLVARPIWPQCMRRKP